MQLEWGDTKAAYKVGQENISISLSADPAEAASSITVESSNPEAVSAIYDADSGKVALTFNEVAESVTLTASIPNTDSKYKADAQSISFSVYPSVCEAPTFDVDYKGVISAGSEVSASCVTPGSTVTLKIGDETVTGEEGAGKVSYIIPSDTPVDTQLTFTATATIKSIDDEGNEINLSSEPTTITLKVVKVLIDVLTVDSFSTLDGSAIGSSYHDVQYKSSVTNVLYYGHMMKGNESIQLRTSTDTADESSHSGIVVKQNPDGYILDSVQIEWNSNTSSGRSIGIYGNNEAYSLPDDLFSDATHGTHITTVEYNSSESVNIAESYNYLGLKPEGGAMYISKITLVWKVPEGYVEKERVEIKWDDDVEGTYTVGDEGITLTLDVTPEEALGCVKVVSSNPEAVTVDYTTVPGLVSLSFNNPAEDVTLTASIKDDEKYADTEASVSFNVIPDMDGLICVTLTAASFGLRNTQEKYEDVTYTSPVTGITYAANMSVNKDAIQLRSSNSNSGIVTTSNPKGYILKRMEIEWSDDTQDQRIVDIYGNSQPYSSATELYGVSDNHNQGTQIGSVGVLGTDVLDVTDPENYFPFIGMRSRNNALYIDRIVLYWEKPQEIVEPEEVFVSVETDEDGMVTLRPGTEIEIFSKNADQLSISINESAPELVSNPYHYTVESETDLVITPVDAAGNYYENLTREIFILIDDSETVRATSTYTFDFTDNSYLGEYSPESGAYINLRSDGIGLIDCTLMSNDDGTFSYNNNAWVLDTSSDFDIVFTFNNDIEHNYKFNKVVLRGEFESLMYGDDKEVENGKTVEAWDGSDETAYIDMLAYSGLSISSIDVTFEHDAVAQPYFEPVWNNDGSYGGAVTLKHSDPNHKILYKIVPDNANNPARAINKYGDGFTEATSEPIEFKSGDTLMMYAEHPHGMVSELYSDSFDNIATGVSSIFNNAPGNVRYFNLQGVEVAEPTEGIFIRIENGKATKIAK